MKSNQKEVENNKFILITLMDRQQGIIYRSLDMVPEEAGLLLNSHLTLRKSPSLFEVSVFSLATQE